MKRREFRATSAEIAISLLMFTGQIEGMALHYDAPYLRRKGLNELSSCTIAA